MNRKVTYLQNVVKERSTILWKQKQRHAFTRPKYAEAKYIKH